jgi:hypothetical protein
MDQKEKIARQLLRLHWYLHSRPGLGQVYQRGLEHLKNLRAELSFLAWKRLGVRPILDRRAVQKIHNENGSASAVTEFAGDMPIAGRLVVRVAFHLARARMKFLVEMLEQLRELPFSEIYIAVDTNSGETKKLLEAAGIDFVNAVEVHENLEHPFKLTWVHRDRLRAVVDQFDYFMYVEDDILIPPQAIRLWHARLPVLKPLGFLPGFMRVELNRAGELVTSDFRTPAASALVRTIEGKHYLDTPYPYQAFWICDKDTMLEFLNSDIYDTGQPGFDIRECMAVGYTFENTPNGPRSRHLLPLVEDGNIDPQAFVFHMPSNYGRLFVPNPAGLGTVLVRRAIQ